MANGITQFGATVPPNTARLTPGQEDSALIDADMQDLLAFANDRETFTDDPEFDSVIGTFQAMDEREEQIKEYGAAARKWFLTDTPKDEVMEYLEPVFGKKLGNEIWKTTASDWKPYRDMYKAAGEYARGERVDPGYVQELDSKDRKLFYAFMMEQASPEQRGALGKFGENWVRGMEDVWDSFEEDLSKFTGMELAHDGTTLGVPDLVLRFSQEPQTLAIEAAVADAAETRRRIRRLREAGDPVESEELLGQGLLDIARMGPRLAGGIATAQAGGPAASVAFWTAQIAPDLEDEMVEMGVAPEKAATFSLLAAIPSAAVEAAQVEGLTPGASQAVKRGAIGFLAGYAKKFGKNWMNEVQQEGIQFLIEEAGKHAALAGEKEMPDVDFTDIIGRGTEEMKRAGVSLGLLTAAGHMPGAFKGASVANKAQRLYDQALLVSQKSTDLKLKQYATTLMTMIDTQTPIDKKSQGLAARVQVEAEGIRQKTSLKEAAEAVKVVEKGRAAEKKAAVKEVIAKAEEKAAEPAPSKEAVPEPEKPVERPKKKAKPKPKKEVKPAPEPPAAAGELTVEQVRQLGKQRKAQTQKLLDQTPPPKKAPPRTKPVPPPATEVAQRKVARVPKAKSGKGIRKIALEVDKAVESGRMTAEEGKQVYTELGLRAVELEKSEGVNLTKVKQSLRTRLGAPAPAVSVPKAAPRGASQATIRKQQARVNKLRKDVAFRERSIKTLKKEHKTAERAQKDRQAAAIQSRIDFNEAQVAKQKAELKGAEKALAQIKGKPAAKPQRPAKKTQKPKPAPAPAKAVPTVEELRAKAPVMGEEVLAPKVPPKPATEHTRAQAMSELELDEKSQGELAEELTDRGIPAAGLSQDQMVDAVIRDAVAGGEIAPIVEGVQPEVAPRAEAVPAHRRPLPAVREGTAGVEGMDQNEVRALRDQINTEFDRLQREHGTKDAMRKFLAANGLASPESIVRKAAEDGNYEAASDALLNLRDRMNKKFGKKSQALRDFRKAFVKSVDLAISEFDTIVGGNIPETILGKRQDVVQRTERLQQQEAAFEEARRRSPEFDAAAAAQEATTQTQDVALGRGERTEAPVNIQSQKNAEAEMRLAEREGQAIEGEQSVEQMVAQSLLDMNDPALIESSYDLIAEEKGQEFADRVKELVEAKSSNTDNVRRSTEDAEGPETFHSGFSPSMFTNMVKTLGSWWESLEASAVKGARLHKQKSAVFEELRRAFASRAYTNEVARKLIGDMFLKEGDRKLTTDEAKLLSFWREDPKNNPLPENLKEIGEQINEVYDVIDDMWKAMGMGTWPTSAINRNGAKIQGLKQDLSKYKEGSKKHTKALEEIADIERENKFLANLRYHRHIVLGKEVTPEVAVALDNMSQRGSLKERLKTTPELALGREYNTLQDLIDDNFEVETDFRVALADVFSYVQNKLLVHEFHESLKQDTDLVLPDAEAPANWVELPGIEPYNRRRFKAGSQKLKVIDEAGNVKTEQRAKWRFKGQKYRVHPILAEAIRDFTEAAGHKTTVGKIFDHVNTMWKQLKFYNPIIMTMNNTQQGFAAAGPSSQLNWKNAFETVMSKDNDYLAMLRADLFSTPSDIRFEEFHDVMRADIEAHFSNDTQFAKWWKRTTGIKNWTEAWKLIPVHANSASYKMARQATWWMDRVARVATVKALMNQRNPATGANWTLSEAVVKAREFHGDYNLLRRQPSKWLRRLFLTPAYKTAMWYRLFPKITQDAAVGLAQAATGQTVTRDVMPMARVLGAISAMTTAMLMLGYSWEDWYRFIRKDESGEGEDVVQMFGPFSEPFKVFGRAAAGFEEGKTGGTLSGLTKATERVLFNNLAAVPKVAVSFQRNRDWKGDRIITPGAPETQQAKELTGFLLRETLPYVGQIQSWGDAEQSTIAKIANIASITMYHRDSTKRKWYKHKLDQRQKELRAWAKEQAGGDPDLSREFNMQAARRYAEYTVALSETLKTYETRLETAKKGDAWLRFANQFDTWAWFHTKIDPGTPSLLAEKKLTELRALQRKSVKPIVGEKREDLIERLMRRAFAGTFLREVADNE